MEVRWRASVPLDFGRLKAALLTWRGGVRFGAAEVVVTGAVVDRNGRRALRVPETGQLFDLREKGAVALPEPGRQVRILGDAALPDRSSAGADLVLTVREHEEVGADTGR